MLDIDALGKFLKPILGNIGATDRYRYVGYEWNPDQNPEQNALTSRALGRTDTTGLFVAIGRANLSQYRDVPPENNADSRFVFPRVNPPNDSLRRALELVLGTEEYKRSVTQGVLGLCQGYLAYIDRCLRYILACGNYHVGGLDRSLLQDLHQELQLQRKAIYIVPSVEARFQIRSGDARCQVSKILDGAHRTPDDQTALWNAVLRAYIAAMPPDAETGRFEVLTWLTPLVNAFPLHSLFEETTHLQGFLNAYHPIAYNELETFIDKGENPFRKPSTGWHEGVDLNDFLRLALIALLYAHTSPGNGMGSQIEVDIQISENNKKRPPAIGLAHELIHAFYNALGMQPGRDFGHYSTTAYELLCVGLGPWSNHPISENAIRSSWIHGLGQADDDHFNGVETDLRRVYHAEENARDARRTFNCI